MNGYHLVGAIMAVGFFALGWFSFRQYKRVGRRCDGKDCGSMDVQRICKIVLAPDETVSFYSSNGKRRWWIRRVVKLTFTVCNRKEKHGGTGWIKLVKIDYDPISLWHALYVRRRHKEQYYLTEPALVEAAQRKKRELYLGGRHDSLDPGASDTPPLSLGSLFEDYFKALSEIIRDD